MKKSIIIFITIIPLLCILGCKTTPEEVEQGLPPAEYFKRAQSAVIERNDYDKALALYQAVLEQYESDRQNGVIAKYEIAFIYYKQEKYDLAKEKFEEILEIYGEESSAQLPPWPPVLAEKLLVKIEEKTK